MTPYPEDLPRWREAARIAARARDLGARWAAPGMTRRELADRLEAFIRAEGAEPSFPANLSTNVEAAHFTPAFGDEDVLHEGDLLKIDVGAHLQGAISDTAITVEVGGSKRYEALRRAVHEGVEAAIAAVAPGVSVDALGRAVEGAVHARGLKPVRNLMGHSIRPYLLHAGKSIPNVGGVSDETLEEGEIVALEPFVTNGAGAIRDGPFGNIVRFRAAPPASDPAAPLFDRFRTLPFTGRWLSVEERAIAAKARRHLQHYPVFVEVGGGFVAQEEHTVLVTPAGADVLTRSP